MPRKNPLGQREVKICGRMRLFREHLGIPRVEFARRLEIDSSTLVRCEHARMPVPYELAEKLAQKFNLNQAWLADGRGDMVSSFDHLIPPAPGEISRKSPFSVVFDTYVTSALQDAERFDLFHVLATMNEEPPVFESDMDESFYLRKLLQAIEKLFTEYPQPIRGAFLQKLIRAIGDFGIEHCDELEAHELEEKASARKVMETGKDDPESSARKPLTDINVLVNNADVKSQLTGLLGRLNKSSSQRGKKTELAKFLGVPLVRVSQWLSGEREPGGETTLRLLKWVEQQER